MENAAIIDIGVDSLLDLLDFKGGVIHEVTYDTQEYWKPRVISIVIEHPDLDKVEVGSRLRHISPSYIKKGGIKRVSL